MIADVELVLQPPPSLARSLLSSSSSPSEVFLPPDLPLLEDLPPLELPPSPPELAAPEVPELPPEDVVPDVPELPPEEVVEVPDDDCPEEDCPDDDCPDELDDTGGT